MATIGGAAGDASPEHLDTLNLARLCVIRRPPPVQGHARRAIDQAVDDNLGARRVIADRNVQRATGE